MTGERREDMRLMALVQRELGDLLEEIQGAARFECTRRVTALVAAEAERERSRCAGLCRERAAVWQRTPSFRSGAPPVAREEARARANEALYLADLLETDGPSGRALRA